MHVESNRKGLSSGAAKTSVMRWKMPQADCFMNETDEKELLSIGKTVRYSKGSIIFFAGQPADELHYVRSGWVNIFKVNDQGKQVSVGLRYRGEFAGVGSFACQGERSCNALAMIDSEIVVIPGERFLALVAKNPGLNTKLFCLMGSRLKETQNSIMLFISNQTDKRLALTLLSIARYLGRADGAKTALNLKLSQEKLAHIIGSSRQTVNRLLNEFVDLSCIEMKGREIISVYPEKLRQRMKIE